MNKYHWIQILKNCDVGLAGHHLDIRFCVPEGLTKEQVNQLDEEIQNMIVKYGEEHDEDYSDMNYNEIIEASAENLNIKFHYPQVDYTIYV